MKRLIIWDPVGFNQVGIAFKDNDDIPLQVRVEQFAQQEGIRLLRDRQDPDCRVVAIRHAVSVVKAAWLRPDKGDIAALRLGLGCSHAFAKKMIQGVAEEKTVRELVGRQTRKESVHSTDLLPRLKVFLEDGEQSRACPGH